MTYHVTVRRESNGTWSAHADGVDGAFTSGQTLAEIDRNIRESIAVSLDLPRGAEDTMAIEQRVRVDSDVDDTVQLAREAREAARHAAELTARAVQMLRRRGLSQRDTARLLGITPARVAQLDHGDAA